MITFPWHHAATVSLAIIPRLPSSPLFIYSLVWPSYRAGHTLTLAIPLSLSRQFLLVRHRPTYAHSRRLGLS